MFYASSWLLIRLSPVIVQLALSYPYPVPSIISPLCHTLYHTALQEEGSFVGLVNQGGTCYMNSLIQQLYHIPAFSSGLLSISDSADDSAGKDGAYKGQDSAIASTAPVEGSDTALAVTKEKEKESAAASGPSSDEKFLFQLQVMFGYLRLSEKRFFDTLSFCKVRHFFLFVSALISVS
jgi:Ubiquitin carboxyl-terminal hydrolase